MGPNKFRKLKALKKMLHKEKKFQYSNFFKTKTQKEGNAIH